MVFALVVSACSSGTDATSTTGAGEPTPTTTADAGTTVTTGGNDAVTTTSAADGTTTTSDRPLAPDFTLELGDGGSYTLSERARPVYLVFWAEW